MGTEAARVVKLRELGMAEFMLQAVVVEDKFAQAVQWKAVTVKLGEELAGLASCET